MELLTREVGERSFQAAAFLPPAWSAFPDLANTLRLDAADGRLRVARHYLTICLKLECGQGTADAALRVHCVTEQRRATLRG